MQRIKYIRPIRIAIFLITLVFVTVSTVFRESELVAYMMRNRYLGIVVLIVFIISESTYYLVKKKNDK